MGTVARVQSVVVGAGVVGLAVARSLARAGREVLVLEASSAIGSVTSSRNSGVIHAGIYYEAGSLKARTCVQGRRELYRFCEEHGVAHRRCGKLIVATDPGQLATLEALRQRSEANGVHGDHEALRLLQAHEVAELEPELRCVGGLVSPSTGIVDAHELMLALQGDAETHGATVVLNSPVTGGRVLGSGGSGGGGGGGSGHGSSGGGGLQAGGRLLISTPELDLEADELINCAGLEAPRVARLLGGVPPRCVPTSHVAKGSYFGLTGKSPFSRLVYPVPEAAGLGVHATVDLGGRCRFGPDVEWVEAGAHWDYQVDTARAASFYAEVRKYWPALPDGALVADYAGARPKIQAPGEAAADFAVQTEAEHGVAGLVNLFGIESPGLTASMALAGLVEAFLVKGAPVGSHSTQHGLRHQ